MSFLSLAKERCWIHSRTQTVSFHNCSYHTQGANKDKSEKENVVDSGMEKREVLAHFLLEIMQHITESCSQEIKQLVCFCNGIQDTETDWTQRDTVQLSRSQGVDRW